MMSRFKVGDKVYRRTINDKVLVAWEVVAMRGWWIFTEYYLKTSKITDMLVIDREYNLFKVPENKHGN